MLWKIASLFAPCQNPSEFSSPTTIISLPDDALEAVLVPLDDLGGVDLVGCADLVLATATAGDTLTGTGHDDVEVHSVDTDRRVVLDAQVDVLGDTETEVAGLGEVALAELVLLDLEATLEDLLGLGATDGDVDGDLLVTADTEGTDGVAGLAVDGGLTAQLLEHLGGTSKSVTRLADGDVQDELLDAQLTHGVGSLVGSALGDDILAVGLLLRGFSNGLYRQRHVSRCFLLHQPDILQSLRRMFFPSLAPGRPMSPNSRVRFARMRKV